MGKYLYRMLKIISGLIIFCLEIYGVAYISSEYGWFEYNYISDAVLIAAIVTLNVLIPVLKKKKGNSYFKAIIFHTFISLIIVFVFMELSSLVNSVPPDVKTEFSDWYYFGSGLVMAILFQIAKAIPELYLYLKKQQSD